MRRILRLLRALLLGVVGLAVVAVLGVLFLRITTPRAADALGWRVGPDMPAAVGEGAGAVTVTGSGEELVVAGGLTGLGRTSAAVHRYEPGADAWTSAPDLPEARHHLGAAGLDGAVWVAGGATGARSWHPQAEVWVLQAGAAAWQPGLPMPEGRWGHRFVALDGRLYAVGGHGASADVLILEPAIGWRTGAGMPGPRDHVAAVAWDGEIWVLGGRDTTDGRVLSRVDIYDPAGDRWRSGPPLPVPTSGAVAGVVEDRLVIVGGEEPAVPGGRVLDRQWILDQDRTTWQAVPDPPLAVHGAAGGVVDGRLHIAGGAGRQGLLSVMSWARTLQVLEEPLRASDG